MRKTFVELRAHSDLFQPAVYSDSEINEKQKKIAYGTFGVSFESRRMDIVRVIEGGTEGEGESSLFKIFIF